MWYNLTSMSAWHWWCTTSETAWHCTCRQADRMKDRLFSLLNIKTKVVQNVNRMPERQSNRQTERITERPTEWQYGRMTVLQNDRIAGQLKCPLLLWHIDREVPQYKVIRASSSWEHAETNGNYPHNWHWSLHGWHTTVVNWYHCFNLYTKRGMEFVC